MIIARHCSSSMQHCSTAAGWSKLPPIITASEEWRHTSWSWSHKVALTSTDLIWAHIYSFRQANIHLKLRHLDYKTTKIANSEWLDTIIVPISIVSMQIFFAFSWALKTCAKINIKRGLQSMHAYNLVEKQEPEDTVRVSGKWSSVQLQDDARMDGINYPVCSKCCYKSNLGSPVQTANYPTTPHTFYRLLHQEASPPPISGCVKCWLGIYHEHDRGLSAIIEYN